MKSSITASEFGPLLPTSANPAKITESFIDQNLIQAFRDTHYRVDTVPPFVLKVGVPSEALRQLYSQYWSDCAAFITACNPFSRSLSDAENTARQAALLCELTGRSLKFINGVGLDSQGNWPGEASFLVLGLSLEATRVLARKYEQNAVVWCDKDAVPELVLLR
jgi:hypothetical protein